MPKPKSSDSRPASEQIRQEIRRVDTRRRFGNVMRNTLAVLLSIAAIAVLVATFLMPVFRIYGSAMSPTVSENEIVIALKQIKPQKGDIVAFYYNNRILVRRIIADPGEVVSVDQYGNVEVNHRRIVERYANPKTAGGTDVEYPLRVPDDGWFVLGDNRQNSIDSRHSVIGCVTQEQMIGKVVCCIWPFGSIRIFEPVSFY